MKKLLNTFKKAYLLKLQKLKYSNLPFHRVILKYRVKKFCKSITKLENNQSFNSAKYAKDLRKLIRRAAFLSTKLPVCANANDLLVEYKFINEYSEILRPALKLIGARNVIFCGQAYYNAWYLSRALRLKGWGADVYNWDSNPSTQIYYHGEDYLLGGNISNTLEGVFEFYINSIYYYGLIHFSNANGISYGWQIDSFLRDEFGEKASIQLLKTLGKKIVYSNNGCLDGVSQTSFAKWGLEPVCNICPWKSSPAVCSDEKNLAWGRFRNSVADFQCLLGGNRIDYNDDPRVHEVPEFYCLDSSLWNPEIEIPEKYKLPPIGERGVRLYHAVGHRADRTMEDGVNIKSSHVYLPLIEKLKDEGAEIQLIEPSGIPNKEVRFLQAQADIFLEMLSYGWFGANAREAMMLEKPVICFIRPEWLESLRLEIPDYAEELPIISATTENVEYILRDLIANPEKRRDIGRRSREFAIKWHSAEAGGRRFDQIYTALLTGEPLNRNHEMGSYKHD